MTLTRRRTVVLIGKHKQTTVRGTIAVTNLRRIAPPLLIAPAGLGIARGLAWATSAPLHAARAGTPTFDQLLALAAATVAWAALGHLVLVLAATGLGALPGAVGRGAAIVAETVTPAAGRRLARLAVGLTVAAGSVASTVPATAAPGGETVAVPAAAASLPGIQRPGGAHQSSPSATPPDGSEWPAIGRPGRAGGWVPDVPPAAAEPTPPAPPVRLVAAVPRDGEAIIDEVVVRRGDSLWQIAARALGGDATDAEIATEWPRWYETNRDVVGDDPDLLLPGTLLRPPAQA
jgi:resuscitation-promoting factor RpfA